MKVIAVFGSPKDKGKSTIVAKQVCKGAEEAGHEVKTYCLNKMHIKGCQECEYCRNNDADCIQKDDLKDYWEELRSADVLLVSSPNYYSMVTGPVITYMNRHYCMKNGAGDLRLPEGKKVIGVFAQGNPVKDGYKDNYEWFMKVFESYGMKVADTIVCTGMDSTDENSEIMKQAYEVGKTL